MSEPSETETVDYWRERVAKIGSPVDALFVLGREYSDPESSLLTSEAILAVVEEIRSSLEAGEKLAEGYLAHHEDHGEAGQTWTVDSHKRWATTNGDPAPVTIHRRFATVGEVLRVYKDPRPGGAFFTGRIPQISSLRSRGSDE